MKKIFSLIIFVMTLFMVSCIDLDPGVVFKVTSEYAYTIGDDTPLYLDGIIATDADGEDLIESVKYDDSLVNYELTGTYTIYFELTMASKSKKDFWYRTCFTIRFGRRCQFKYILLK